MSQSSSWLPIVALVILLSSLMAWMDTYILRNSKEFFINLHIAVVDFIVGLILLNELNKSADRLILLAAAYLSIKGLFRIFAANNLEFSDDYSAISGGRAIASDGDTVVAGMAFFVHVVHLFLPQRRHHDPRLGSDTFRIMVKIDA